jgi:hypothetical protein
MCTTGLPDYFYKTPQNIPNGHEIHKNDVSIPNGHEILQHFSFQGTPKFTQLGIFGMKIYHLATLVPNLTVTHTHK